MTTVQEIEEALGRLPKDRLAEFRAWYVEFDASRWDEQLEQDAKSGKLDRLADEAVKDLDSNRCTEW